MATYAIGDIQGCYDDLQQLLDKINFCDKTDTLWFAGDLVNRGPDSLKTLRFIKSLGKNAVTVLGNHDLTLLALSQGISKVKHHTLNKVLKAHDRDELLYWLRHQKLIHHNSELGYTMVHAGIYHQWNLKKSIQLAAEVEKVLQSKNYKQFFSHMYGNEPQKWNDKLTKWDRLRFITNTFTRMRYCTVDGKLSFSDNGYPGSQQSNYHPWYRLAKTQSLKNRIIFGHWSSLVGKTRTKNIYALDTGCLWSGKLTAIKLAKKKHKGKHYEHKFFTVKC
jgi:bis(5'-nucleosyl)-tetraphosphatase (symmetrical)